MLRIVHGLVGVADGAGPVAQVILRRVRAPRLALALLDAGAALGGGSVGGAGVGSGKLLVAISCCARPRLLEGHDAQH